MEAAAQVKSAGSGGALDYFKKYSGMPREGVLTHDLLRDGHWFDELGSMVPSAQHSV